MLTICNRQIFFLLWEGKKNRKKKKNIYWFTIIYGRNYIIIKEPSSFIARKKK